MFAVVAGALLFAVVAGAGVHSLTGFLGSAKTAKATTAEKKKLGFRKTALDAFARRALFLVLLRLLLLLILPSSAFSWSCHE